MCEFPPSQRIPSLQATLRLILSLYLEKLMYDKLCDANHKRRVELGAFPHKYLLKKFGLQNLADEQCTQLVAAVAFHKDESKRVRLFGEYLGMTDFAQPPIYGVRDGNFVFGILVALRKANEFTEAVCFRCLCGAFTSRRGRAPQGLHKRSMASGGPEDALRVDSVERGGGSPADATHRVDAHRSSKTKTSRSTLTGRRPLM